MQISKKSYFHSNNRWQASSQTAPPCHLNPNKFIIQFPYKAMEGSPNYYYSIMSMNFAILGRTSNAPTIHTDRPSVPSASFADTWKKMQHESNLLNASQSKVNFRCSLHKTSENISFTNNEPDSTRPNGFVANPIATYQYVRKESVHQKEPVLQKESVQQKESVLQDKSSKTGKAKMDSCFQVSSKLSKDEAYKSGTTTPTSFIDEDRKNNEPSFLRHSLKNGSLLLNLRDELTSNKDSQRIEEIRSQIIALTKRVFINEDQILRLKEKQEKDKKVVALEQQFLQLQTQAFDTAKRNSAFFADFQYRIDKSTALVNEVREKVFMHNKEEELLKRLSACELRVTELNELRVSELNELSRKKDEDISQTITSLVHTLETHINHMISDQMGEVSLRLDKNAVQKNQILLKIIKLEEELKEKDGKAFEYKTDSRKCYNPIIIENRQVLLVRQNERVRDSTKHLGSELTPKKDYSEYLQKLDTPRKENRESLTQSKRQITLKQRTYYIDSQGYLLDQNKYYLLNCKNQQILIPEHLLRVLRQNNMLATPSPSSNANLLLKRL